MTDQQQIDAELMAALFVSDDGEIRIEPDWVPGGCPWTPAPPGWDRLSVPESVGAGILRLMRERDDAQAKYERQCAGQQSLIAENVRLRQERDNLSRECNRIQIRLDAVVENRDAMQEERDEALAQLAECRRDQEALWKLIPKPLA
jgi:hypothetical protein